MVTDDYKRKLAAIFSADVVGYSRLMGDDEAATVATITAYRKILSNYIQMHDGRVLDAKGDNILAEFDSVVVAVTCAVEIQEILAQKNRAFAESRRMQFRIGINLGDVIQKGETIYGDGVNIAARLEGLAAPGGICVSKSVFDQVENKLPFRFFFLGKHPVKNIPIPVHAYGVERTRVDTRHQRRIRYRPAARKAVVGLILFGLMAAVGYYTGSHHEAIRSIWGARGESSHVGHEAPSLVIYPFPFLGTRPDGAVVSEKITEDLFQDLSMIAGMQVSMASVLTEEDSPSNGDADKLDARQHQFYLTGEITPTKEQLMVNVQLGNDGAGRIVWSESYSCGRGNTDVVKSDIVWRILSHLNIQMSGEEKRLLQASQKPIAATTPPAGPTIDPATRQAKAAADASLKMQLTFWESIMDATDPELYQEYLKQFPRGIFKELAQKKIQILNQAKAKAKAQEPPAANQMAAMPVPRKTTSTEYELVFWQSVEHSSNIELFADYLRRFPEGIFASIAAVRLAELEDLSQAQGPEAVVLAPGKTEDDNRSPAKAPVGLPVDQSMSVVVLPWSHRLAHWYNPAVLRDASCQIISSELTVYPFVTLAENYSAIGGRKRYSELESPDFAANPEGLWELAHAFAMRTPNMELAYRVGQLTGADLILLYRVQIDLSPADSINIWLADPRTKTTYFKRSSVLASTFEADFKSAFEDVFLAFAADQFRSYDDYASICWDFIKRSRRQEAFRQYLQMFPDSTFSGIARLKAGF